MRHTAAVSGPQDNDEGEYETAAEVGQIIKAKSNHINSTVSYTGTITSQEVPR